jgi:hypothetical protein
VDIADNVIKVSTHPDFPVHASDTIWLRFPIHKIRWMDIETGQMLTPVTESQHIETP